MTRTSSSPGKRRTRTCSSSSSAPRSSRAVAKPSGSSACLGGPCGERSPPGGQRGPAGHHLRVRGRSAAGRLRADRAERARPSRARPVGAAWAWGSMCCLEAAEARWRSEPHVALRLHGEQVGVPRPRLLAEHLLPGDGAQHHRGRGHRRAVHQARCFELETGSGLRRRPEEACSRRRSTSSSTSCSMVTTTRTSGSPRPKKRGLLNLQEHHGRAPEYRGREERRHSSRSTACSLTARSSRATRSSSSSTS